jgi:hypothetical protein
MSNPMQALHVCLQGFGLELAVLNLRFAQISGKFCLQMGDIVIKFLQLVLKCIRIGPIADSNTASQFLGQKEEGGTGTTVLLRSGFVDLCTTRVFLPSHVICHACDHAADVCHG